MRSSIFQLRFDQEIVASQRDAAGDLHATPPALDALQRSYLRDSLRAIAIIQAAVRKAWGRGDILRLEMP